jgi:hypothetical protein
MKKPRVIGRIVATVAIVLGCIGLLSSILDSWNKVRSGRGLETFYNVYGVEWNHIGLLVTLAVIPIALLIGWAASWWESREERDLKKTSGIKK